MNWSRRLLGCLLISALALAPAMLRAVPARAAVAWEDSTGQLSDDREAGSAPTRTHSQPTDKMQSEPPDEVSESRFSAKRIIIAATLQVLLLAVIAGFILWLRSVRRRWHPREQGSRGLKGGRRESNTGSGRASSGQSAGPLQPVRATRATPGASIGAAPEQEASSYLCLSLADGRTVEGLLRGEEGNGHVMIVDVEFVIEPDGTRRRGTAEDSFVPVSTIEGHWRVEGPRSA